MRGVAFRLVDAAMGGDDRADLERQRLEQAEAQIIETQRLTAELSTPIGDLARSTDIFLSHKRRQFAGESLYAPMPMYLPGGEISDAYLMRQWIMFSNSRPSDLTDSERRMHMGFGLTNMNPLNPLATVDGAYLTRETVVRLTDEGMAYDEFRLLILGGVEDDINLLGLDLPDATVLALRVTHDTTSSATPYFSTKAYEMRNKPSGTTQHLINIPDRATNIMIDAVRTAAMRVAEQARAADGGTESIAA